MINNDGRKVEVIIKRLKEPIGKVEEWPKKWGLRFPVDKTKIIFFIRKRN